MPSLSFDNVTRLAAQRVIPRQSTETDTQSTRVIPRQSTENVTHPINITPDTIGQSNEGANLSSNPSAPTSEPSATPTEDETFFRSDNPVAYVAIGAGVVGVGTLAYFASQ
jgi:hypothetical protein